VVVVFLRLKVLPTCPPVCRFFYFFFYDRRLTAVKLTYCLARGPEPFTPCSEVSLVHWVPPPQSLSFSPANMSCNFHQLPLFFFPGNRPWVKCPRPIFSQAPPPRGSTTFFSLPPHLGSATNCPSFSPIVCTHLRGMLPLQNPFFFCALELRNNFFFFFC